jgi:hypothetical protein
VLPPRLRILVTTCAALAVAVGAALALVGSQESSGRADLTVRARSFLRSLKGEESDGAGRRPSPDPTEFLRPVDRGSARNVVALVRLRNAFGDTNDDLLVAQVKLLGDGKAVTYTPVTLGVPMGRRRLEAGLREIAWVRDADGRWYLDPAGL